MTVYAGSAAITYEAEAGDWPLVARSPVRALVTQVLPVGGVEDRAHDAAVDLLGRRALLPHVVDGAGPIAVAGDLLGCDTGVQQVALAGLLQDSQRVIAAVIFSFANFGELLTVLVVVQQIVGTSTVLAIPKVLIFL